MSLERAGDPQGSDPDLERVRELARAVRGRGGRALVVGGSRKPAAGTGASSSKATRR